MLPQAVVGEQIQVPGVVVVGHVVNVSDPAGGHVPQECPQLSVPQLLEPHALGFLTVIITGFDVEEFPKASVAVAVIVYCPGGKACEFAQLGIGLLSPNVTDPAGKEGVYVKSLELTPESGPFGPTTFKETLAMLPLVSEAVPAIARVLLPAVQVPPQPVLLLRLTVGALPTVIVIGADVGKLALEAKLSGR